MAIRARFKKGAEIRFISHLNLMGCVERTLRRAGLPIRYSGRYNPRPRIAFGSALAVGMTSGAEYADFELREPVDVEDFKDRFNGRAPSGLDLLEARSIGMDADSLMAIIDTAEYRIDNGIWGLDAREVSIVAARVMECDELTVVRRRKKGDRTVDLRPLIHDLSSQGYGAFLRALVGTGSRGNVRPEELAAVLDRFADSHLRYNPAGVHREGLFVSRDGGLIPPIELG